MSIATQIESKDTKHDIFVKEKAKYIMQIASNEFIEDIRYDYKCWNIYNNKRETEKFKYLTDVEGFTYPAKLRNIGNEIVKSKINLLESKQSRRKFRFKAVTIDEQSLNEKHRNRIKAYLKSIRQIYEDRIEMLQVQIEMVMNKLQDIKAQLQMNPENEEIQLQQQKLLSQFPLIEYEYNKILKALTNQKIEIEDINKNIGFYLSQTEQEIIQQLANATIKSAIQTEDLIEHWNTAFKEKIVTGKPYYIIYYDERKNDIVFRQIDSHQCYYSRGGSNKWTHEGEWCAIKEYMDMQQIMSEFELTESEHNILKAYNNGDYTTLVNYLGNSAYYDNAENMQMPHNKIEVWRIWFNEPHEIYYKKSPNKRREGEYFYNLVDKDAKIKKDEERKRVVFYDQYHCTVIGNVICLNHGKQDKVFRPKDIPGIPQLPLVGRTYNKLSEQANSIVYRVKDLIELYDIINYKKEMTIALSGVKGIVMDKSQIPDGMSAKKWLYYRRIGTMYIETIKKGRKIPATFNQFQTYDDGLSETIQWFDYMLNNIENIISKIMGITPSAEGQFVSQDAVANVKMSNEQSALITEILFYENDKIFSKALELYVNLKAQYVWNNGKVVNYLNEDIEEVLIQIPKNLLDKSNYRIYINNNIREDALIDDIRQVAINSWTRSQLPLSSLVSLFKTEDLNDMEAKLIQFSKEAEYIAQQNNMAVENMKAEAEQKRIQLQGQIDMEVENIKYQVEAAKLQLEQAKFQFEQEVTAWEQQFKQKELEVNTQLKSMEIASENNIESAYLEEEGRSNRVQEMLKSFEIKINAILGEMGIKAGDLDSKRKSTVQLRNMRNKENIKD